MKIASASVSLQAQHHLSLTQRSEQRLQVWTGSRQSATGNTSSPKKAGEKNGEVSDFRITLLKLLVEMLTGRTIRLTDAADITGETAAATGTETTPAAETAGYGIAYDYHTFRQESEQTDFSAGGTVKTADGREISFQLTLSMSRTAIEQTDISFRAGDALRQDPLVINFDGNAAQLLDTRFSFDLEGKGKLSSIPALSGGSGYLAIDKNGNGKIDSGTELFGPSSGQGFQELAAYDQDGNGWIDENDPVFAQLRVWQPGPNGQGGLTNLAEAGVGALGLANTASPFALRGQGNQDLGDIKASGIYLSEAGILGSLQEVDLAV